MATPSFAGGDALGRVFSGVVRASSEEMETFVGGSNRYNIHTINNLYPPYIICIS
jgi:hypothetical protein